MTNLITKINGVDIVTVERDGEIFVPVKPICEAITVNYTSQLEKLQSDVTFSTSTVPLRGIVAADGKEREMVCLPLWLVYLWLGTINPKNVDENVRPKVMMYRLECARVLYQHFAGAAKRQQQQNEAEKSLLERKATALEAISGHKKAISEEQSEIKRVDDQLAKLQSERLNPQPSLFL